MSKVVLIVEDDSDTRGFLKILLESKGCNVIEAEDGLQALQGFQMSPPNLILMDILLPGCDGLKMTRKIRRMPHGALIPIIAMTAAANITLKKALAAGCTTLVKKPFEFAAFMALLAQYLTDI